MCWELLICRFLLLAEKRTDRAESYRWPAIIACSDLEEIVVVSDEYFAILKKLRGRVALGNLLSRCASDLKETRPIRRCPQNELVINDRQMRADPDSEFVGITASCTSNRLPKILDNQPPNRNTSKSLCFPFALRFHVPDWLSSICDLHSASYFVGIAMQFADCSQLRVLQLKGRFVGVFVPVEFRKSVMLFASLF